MKKQIEEEAARQMKKLNGNLPMTEQSLSNQGVFHSGFISGANFALSLDRWVKIEDGLPEEHVRVLLFCKRHFEGDAEIVIGYANHNDSSYPFSSWEFHEDEDVTVTHWQPLPAPPKIV